MDGLFRAGLDQRRSDLRNDRDRFAHYPGDLHSSYVGVIRGAKLLSKADDRIAQ
jgi:hypothetical protein